MISLFRKWRFKRELIRNLKRDLLSDDAGLRWFTYLLEERKKQVAAEEYDLSVIEDEIERIKDSHERADRDRLKELKGKALNIRNTLQKFDALADSAESNINSKRENLALHEKKLKWVKENY